MGSTTLVLRPVEIAQLLDSREGPIGRKMLFLAQRTRDVARQLAPVDTGELRDSISWSWGAGAGHGRNSVTISAVTNYAWYVEHGTRRNAAQPFMEPALLEAMKSL